MGLLWSADRARKPSLAVGYRLTWELSLGRPQDAVVTVYLRDGRVRRAAVDLARPGDRVITIPG
jgi:hypothetical protein